MEQASTLRRTAGAALTVAVLIVPGSVAFGQQQGARRCNLPREENGLIRGDRVPAGCVLTEDDGTHPDGHSAPRPYVVSEGTVFFTPAPNVIMLSNGALLSDGKLIVPRTGPRRSGPIDAPATAGRFGPLQRHFGPLERHFGPLKRHFGPLQRKFGARPPLRKLPPDPRDGQ